jgi:ABC-type glutathione transport system ATPase component
VAGEDEDVSAESAKMQQLLKLRAAAFDGQLKSRLFNDPVMMVAEGQQGDPTSSADLAATPFAVEVYGLSKVFKGGSNRGACLPAAQKIVHDGRVAAATSRSPTAQASGGKAGDFCAIAGSWFGIEEGQLFCLLGPNGAGKTTTINCLTGR